MTKPKIDLSAEPTRAYVYRVALAVLVVLALYRVVAGDAIDEWTELLRAVLGIAPVGLAVANTSTKG